MGEALAIARTAEAERRRRALGPSERPAAVARLLASSRAEPTEVARPRLLLRTIASQIVSEEELAAIVTFGGTEVVEMFEALRAGHRELALTYLSKAGLSLHHGIQLLETLGPAIGEHAVEVAAGGVVAVGASALEAALIETAVAMAAIADAHADGERDAAVYKYAEVWSRIVVDALYGGDVVRPAHEPLAHLEHARARAVHDAFETLRRLGGDGLAVALKQELGTASNARRALVDALLERAGIRGVRLHAEAVR